MWIYKPDRKLVGHMSVGSFADSPVDVKRCRAEVTWDKWHWRQCGRKAVMTVGEYGFCKQHGKKAEKELKK